MATENTSTPSGTGPLTVHGAAQAFASLLSDDELGGTQAGGEAEQTGKPAEGEHVDEEQQTPEGSEHEGEEGSESQHEEEGGEGEHQELSDDTKLSVDGQEVTLHELKRGFLREQDYTRKTQALAEQRKQLEAATTAELGVMRTERAQLAQALTQVQTFMQELMPKEPDWQVLLAQDPAQYAAQRELWRSYHEQLQAVEGKRRALAEQEHAVQQQAFQKYVQEEQGKLLTALPDWNKPEVAKAERQKILDWGQKNGYSEQELLSIFDHRALLVARKAMLYDEMMAKQRQLRPTPGKGPKPAIPGTAGKAPGKATDLTRSKQRLAQTGKVRDAADAIFHMLGDE